MGETQVALFYSRHLQKLVVTGRPYSAEAKQPAQRTWGTRSLPMLLVGELPIRRAHPTAGAALPFEDLRLCSKGGREEAGGDCGYCVCR